MFLLWPSHFILSGAISNCPSLFPSSILDTYQPGGLIFQCHVFLPSHTLHGVLGARILEWVAMSPSSGPCFVRTLHYDPSILCSPAPLSYHSFIQLHKSLYHDKAVIHEGGSIYPTGQFLNHFCRTLFLRHQMWLCGLGLKEKKMPIESTDPPPLTLGPHP